MQRPKVLVLVCISILSIPSVSWSKGELIKIVIDGDNTLAPIEITNPEIVRQFNIWNGPGVSTRGPDGVLDPPAHMDPDKTAGRFIDWPRGIVTDRPRGMQRLEVTFHIDGPTGPVHSGEYRFLYEIDTAKQRGYIYLPRSQGGYISHGIEGNWFHAAEPWDKLIMPVIKRALAEVAALGAAPTINTASGPSQRNAAVLQLL
jgi:hypothetical protein